MIKLRRALTLALMFAIAFGWSVRPAPLRAREFSTRPSSSRDPEVSTADDSAVTLSWGTLAGLDYRRGSMTSALTHASDKRVRIPGFIVPLEDLQESAKEMLLVPYYGACVHTPPPPPNQMVYVRMSGGSTKLSLFAPVWIEGRLTIAMYDSPYGTVGFQMTADKITPYQYDP